MNKLLLYYLIIFYSFVLYGNENTWSSYWNQSKTLIGFKDINGNIKIEPKYITAMSNISFNNIIIVTEQNNNKYSSYYLTKSGRQIHKTIYTYDNSVDIENEGFIRFRNELKDTVGMLDKNGNIVIPSIYNDLKKVNNGLVVALKGANKESFDKHNESDCNHYTWAGGQIYLIDTNNNILIENYINKSSYDMFSLKIDPEPNEELYRVNFLGTNGKYYSFIDNYIEFDDYVHNKLIIDLSIENLVMNSYKVLSYRNDAQRKIFISNIELIKNNYSKLFKILSTISNEDSDYFISQSQLYPFFYDNNYFEDLNLNFKNMGINASLYFSIIINHDNKDQDQLFFLKIDGVYKLIDISLESASCE